MYEKEALAEPTPTSLAGLAELIKKELIQMSDAWDMVKNKNRILSGNLSEKVDPSPYAGEKNIPVGLVGSLQDSLATMRKINRIASEQLKDLESHIG